MILQCNYIGVLFTVRGKSHKEKVVLSEKTGTDRSYSIITMHACMAFYYT